MNIEKEKRAIQYLKSFEPETEPYYGCYSGGKDSDTIRILLKLSGVKHDLVHNLTTVDSPQTVNYIKSIPEVIISRPPITMWDLIVKKMFPPTRLARYCCEVFKESGGKGRIKVTGVRRAESKAREINGGFVKIIGKPRTIQMLGEKLEADFTSTPKGGVVLNTDNDVNRRFVEQCYRTTSALVNPIVDWTDEDVWEFLHYYGCESNPEYKCGESRIGCIGCPLAGFRQMKRDFIKHPKYEIAYIRAFDRMIEARKEKGLPVRESWEDGKSVMKWWVGDDPLQLSLFDEESEVFI